MALIHQQLYRSNDLSSINFGDYLRNLTTHLFQAYGVNEGNIRLTIDAKNIYIGIDTAIPSGLLINELISNSLKHAFPGNRKGKINVQMENIEENKFNLIISDNGIGFPEDIDFRNTKSLGMQLVITLTDQIDGRIELIRGNGTTFKITFISINYKKRV
jgi:two-component sensor histidine kinase